MSNTKESPNSRANCCEETSLLEPNVIKNFAIFSAVSNKNPTHDKLDACSKTLCESFSKETVRAQELPVSDYSDEFKDTLSRTSTWISDGESKSQLLMRYSTIKESKSEELLQEIGFIDKSYAEDKRVHVETQLDALMNEVSERICEGKSDEFIKGFEEEWRRKQKVSILESKVWIC